MKKIVIIGANDFQKPLIQKAKEMGYETHVFAWREGATGAEDADFFYEISIVEMDAILEECRKIKPDAVATIGSDLANITVQYLAEKLGLPVASKPDSQEICFIPDHDYASFIEEYTGKTMEPGNFVDLDGNVLGRHKGISHYTVGQRKGLNLAMGYPVFVVAIRPETNEVVLGNGQDVFTDVVRCNKLNWMALEGVGEEEISVNAKIRYSHKGAPCKIRRIGEDMVECRFEEPVRAATPGQAVVFYQDDYVAGGGTIL